MKKNKFKRRKIKLAVSEICDSLNTQLKTAENNLNKEQKDYNTFKDSEKYKELKLKSDNATIAFQYLGFIESKLTNDKDKNIIFINKEQKDLTKKVKSITDELNDEKAKKFPNQKKIKNLENDLVVWNKKTIILTCLEGINDENPHKNPHKNPSFYEKKLESFKEGLDDDLNKFLNLKVEKYQPVKDAQDIVNNLKKQLKNNNCP